MAAPTRKTSDLRYSCAVQAKATLDITLGGAADYTWNSFQRAAYETAAQAIQRQANVLLRRGNVNVEEARQLVEVQRNGLILATRDRLTPFGKYYSEILKPSQDLKAVDQLLAEKGTIEAVLRSVGKTRQAVNRIAFVARRVGPAAILIDITLTIVVINIAPVGQREQVAAGQVGGVAGSIVGGRYGGLAGAWAGATTFALIGSPSLTIPVVGEVTEGGAAVAGAVVGFFFGGLLGWDAGQSGGVAFWRLVSVQWKTI